MLTISVVLGALVEYFSPIGERETGRAEAYKNNMAIIACFLIAFLIIILFRVTFSSEFASHLFSVIVQFLLLTSGELECRCLPFAQAC